MDTSGRCDPYAARTGHCFEAGFGIPPVQQIDVALKGVRILSGERVRELAPMPPSLQKTCQLATNQVSGVFIFDILDLLSR